MSLDVTLTCLQPCAVFESNITHNLGRMATQAGIYDCVWRPDEKGIVKASQLIEPLSRGIELMKRDPEIFRKYDAPNGWGTYDRFLPWLENYLRACREYPDSDISVSR